MTKKVIEIESFVNKQIAASQSKIDKWMSDIGTDKASAFMSFARKTRSPARIHAYLHAHGLDIGMSSVYRWIDTNLKAGIEAAKVNKIVEGYEGVDIIGVLSMQATVVHQMLAMFTDIIKEASDNGELQVDLKSVMVAFPALSRELRSILSTIEQTKIALDTESLILTGADRLKSILLNAPTVKDTSEEGWITETINAAMQKLREEVNAA